MRDKLWCCHAPLPFPQCRSGRAREGFMGEVIFELGDVFIEVGSEAFCWEGNKEQKEGKRPPGEW